MKKYGLYFSFAIVCLITVVYGSGILNQDITPEYTLVFDDDIDYVEFNEAIITSNCIVSARLEDISVSEFEIEYRFTLNENLKNNIDTNSFKVVESLSNVNVTSQETGEDLYNYQAGDYNYEIGNDYILILSKFDSVYYEEAIYSIIANIYIPLFGDTIQTIQSYQETVTECNVSTKFEFIEYINQQLQSKTPYEQGSSTYIKEYTKSNQLDDIVKDAKYIVKVKANAMEVEGIDRTNTYEFTVLESYKGDINFFPEPSQIVASVFKGDVELGEEYILMLDDISQTSLYYVLSSKNSVVSTDYEDEIMNLLSK